MQPCQCGKIMIVCQTGFMRHDTKLKLTQYLFRWWCGGCGRYEGMVWQYERTGDSDMDRWKRANGLT